MARYTVVTYEVDVVGRGWAGQRIATTYDIPREDGKTFRALAPDACYDAVERWVAMHSGDFSRVDDWAASLDDIDIPFRTEAGEEQWQSLMGEVSDE